MGLQFKETRMSLLTKVCVPFAVAWAFGRIHTLDLPTVPDFTKFFCLTTLQTPPCPPAGDTHTGQQETLLPYPATMANFFSTTHNCPLESGVQTLPFPTPSLHVHLFF